MSCRKRILCVVSTRPEAIKMAPVILALRETIWCDLDLVVTAQHREILDDVFRFSSITPDHDLDLMRSDQGLSDFAARALAALDAILAGTRLTLYRIAQGDTTTVVAAAMAAFYRKVPFCHVEAGLRTHDLQQPFPRGIQPRRHQQGGEAALRLDRACTIQPDPGSGARRSHSGDREYRY